MQKKKMSASKMFARIYNKSKGKPKKIISVYAHSRFLKDIGGECTHARIDAHTMFIQRKRLKRQRQLQVGVGHRQNPQCRTCFTH